MLRSRCIDIVLGLFWFSYIQIISIFSMLCLQWCLVKGSKICRSCVCNITGQTLVDQLLCHTVYLFCDDGTKVVVDLI